MMNVVIVVSVLMTSCQVFEKLKIGPVTSQIKTIDIAETKAAVDPLNFVALRASDSNGCDFFMSGFFGEIFSFRSGSVHPANIETGKYFAVDKNQSNK
jgi:hypothetical protein